MSEKHRLRIWAAGRRGQALDVIDAATASMEMGYDPIKALIAIALGWIAYELGRIVQILDRVYGGGSS